MGRGVKRDLSSVNSAKSSSAPGWLDVDAIIDDHPWGLERSMVECMEDEGTDRGGRREQNNTPPGGWAKGMGGPVMRRRCQL